MGPGLRRDDTEKMVTSGIKLYSLRSIPHDRSIDSHGPPFPGTTDEIPPRHRRPAGSAGLRPGAVCLSGQPFPQPRARQYLDGCAGRRHLLPYGVLAISARRDRVLHRRAGPCRPRDLGAVPAPAIPLEGDRAAAARARPEHSRADHRPYHRRAARRDPVRPRKALSAGVLRLLGGVAVQDPADVRGAADRLDPRLHRALFLAADADVLQARGAVSARRRDIDSDAGDARPLSGRPQRGRRQRQHGMADGKSRAAAGRHRGRAGRAGKHRGIFPGRLFRPARTGAAGKGRARAGGAARRHDQFVLRKWPNGPRAEGTERARGEPAL